MATSLIERARVASQEREGQLQAIRIRDARRALQRHLKVFGLEVEPEEITVDEQGNIASFFAGLGVTFRYYTLSGRFCCEYYTRPGLRFAHNAEVPAKFPGGLDDALVWLGGMLRRWDREDGQ